MGHWVTLDDGQKVFIGSGGRVLATRGAISSAAGGKERGKALAERSRAAVARGLTKARKAKTSRQSGLVPKSEQTTKEERLAAIVERSKAREYGQSKDVFFKTPFQGRKLLPSKEEVKAEVARQNRVAGTEKAKATRIAKSKGESPATTRAIEHARAAGPSLREQADRAKATGWRGQRLSGDMPRESRNKNLAMIRGWTQEQTRKYVGGITNKFAQRGVKAGEGIALPQDMASNRWKVYSHAEVKKAIQRSIVRHGTGKKYDAYLPG